MKCCRIQTTGQSTSTGGNHQVIRSGQTGDTVKQDHDILFMFDKALCALDHHLGYSLMMLGKFIESRVNDFYIISVDRFPNIGNFLRSFIDQQDQHMHLRIAT